MHTQICMYTHTYHVHKNIHRDVHIHTHTPHTHIYICTHGHTYAHGYMHAPHTHICVSVNAYSHLHPHMHILPIHTQPYAYTRTHICTEANKRTHTRVPVSSHHCLWLAPEPAQFSLQLGPVTHSKKRMNPLPPQRKVTLCDLLYDWKVGTGQLGASVAWKSKDIRDLVVECVIPTNSTRMV